MCARAADILLRFKESLEDPAAALTTWERGTNPCGTSRAWAGVLCAPGGVAGLRLERAALQGRLSGDLAWIVGLEELHLAGNGLYGARW